MTFTIPQKKRHPSPKTGNPTFLTTQHSCATLVYSTPAHLGYPKIPEGRSYQRNVPKKQPQCLTHKKQGTKVSADGHTGMK